MSCRPLLPLACLALLGLHPTGHAQTPTAPTGWQACTALASNSTARLACFDRWAGQQAAAPLPAPAAAPAQPAVAVAPARQTPAPVVINLTTQEGCKNQAFSDFSRFWELENGSDCGTFGIRGYRPLSLSVARGSSVNGQPGSPSAANNAASPVNFSRTETRVQLSVRTKIAKDILTGDHPRLKDSLWFAYSQQSYWQLFNKSLSRPFRSTDHEPEVIYTYPSEADLPGGWQLRYSGVGVVHQSNGQSLPLSRSWNRVYLMAGAEKGSSLRVMGRVWRRIPESNGTDDNPDISNYVGRAEVTGYWNPNMDNMLGVTVRHSLRSDKRGSVRLEWFKTLGNGDDSHNLSGLRLHTQIFSGYGDTLLDYNKRRTVLNVGLSLVDW